MNFDFFRIKFFYFIFLVLLVFFSCKHNTQIIIEDYNSEISALGQEKFDPNALLLTKYPVEEKSDLFIAAPEGCEKYLWEFYFYDEANSSFKPMSQKKSIGDERIFVLSSYGNVSCGTYRLELSLEREGKKYFAWCDVIVYKSPPQNTKA